ncbi:hypothetical protein QUF79_06675 [Fictibacillus enclensis]|uniref:hypothetical protein n=1 Tax=Fictibacillus enclensis TaxID=1017270 RepID=UPI0025A1647D|nr:hypothetical protein [Fictibacillus enclensis]MDM5197696.1 hypothetical protein [Fictibacillus enclensis]
MSWIYWLFLAAGLFLIFRMLYSLNTTRQYSFRNTQIIRQRKKALFVGLIGISGLLLFLIVFVVN